MRRSALIIATLATLLVPLLMGTVQVFGADTISEPQDLVAKPGNGLIKLSWTKPALGGATIQGYRIYRGGTATSLEISADLAPTITSYTDHVENGVLHYYAVTAYNALIESDPSNTASCAGDGIEPVVDIFSPENGDYLSVGSITSKWSGSDVGSGINGYEISLDDLKVKTGSNTEYTFTGVDEGNHSLAVSAFDVAGNTGSDDLWFVVDRSAPIVDMMSPIEDQCVSDRNLTVSWTTSDLFSGVSESTLTIDEKVYQTDRSMETTIPSLKEGPHNLVLEVFDKAGNMAATYVNFTVDWTSPAVYIQGHPPFIGIDEVDIQVKVFDEIDNHPMLRIELNGETMEGSNTPGFILIKGLKQGTNDISITAADRAGNTGMDRTSIYYDNVPPEIETDLSEINSLNSRYLDLSLRTIDDGSGVKDLIMSLDQYPPRYLLVNGTNRINFRSDGEHKIVIKALDWANNSAERSFIFLIDGTVPEVLRFSPTGFVENTSTFISVTFSERMDQDRTIITSPILTGSMRWSDNTATFHPDTLPLGYRINVTVSGYDLAGNAMRERTFEFETSSEGSVTGTVVGPGGDPISGAVVTLDNGRSVTTKGDGTFSISDRGGDDRFIIVSKSGYDEVRMDLPIVPGREYRAGIIRLEKAGPDGPSFTQSVLKLLWILILIAAPIGLLAYLVMRVRREKEYR